jgi:hypothetical protein
MSKVITLDKGRKRRLKQIRWKLFEILSLVLLAVLGVAMGILAEMWELDHEHPHSEPTKTPRSGMLNPHNHSTQDHSVLQS